ncbi:hypothetical protein KC19_VG027000 [Ceratodon purpureus]|uniref:Uncharacterized protein n=1 Tax=Ceratodon purpureus TaxID=3225 RepID=A0A8T0HLB6_CERPU|nr:hypothetical protein KC19_VG027000 [Ceratodon purpureus]
MRLLTPLQKWQYEMGLPVEGVWNSRRWAEGVGLVSRCKDESTLTKKPRVRQDEEPSKFGGRSSINPVHEEDMNESLSEEEDEADDDGEVKNSLPSRKGKNQW